MVLINWTVTEVDHALVVASLIFFLWWLWLTCFRYQPYSHSEWIAKMKELKIGTKKG